MIVYRVENADGIGPFEGLDSSAEWLLKRDFLMLRWGDWKGLKSFNDVIGDKWHRANIPGWLYGCQSLQRLGRYFPYEHESLRGFRVAIYHCEVYEERKLEIAFNPKYANRFRTEPLRVLFEALSEDDVQEIAQRQAVIDRDPERARYIADMLASSGPQQLAILAMMR